MKGEDKSFLVWFFATCISFGAWQESIMAGVFLMNIIFLVLFVIDDMTK